MKIAWWILLPSALWICKERTNLYLALENNGKTCEEMINCPKLVGSCGNHYRAQCNFSCPSGYRLNGSSSRTFVAQRDSPSGFWDKRRPTCHVVICGPLIPPTNATFSPSTFLTSSTYNQTCRFSCPTSECFLIGSSSGVCGNERNWRGSNNARCRLLHDEMKSNIEGRTPHCKLAGGILAGVVTLILIIFTFIYIKKLRGPTCERPPLKPIHFTGVAFGDESNHRTIRCEDMKSQATDSPIIFEDSIPFHSSGFERDAPGHNNWNENKIIFGNSAALHLKYTTQAEGLFDRTGGVLNAAPNSDVQIIIKNGAIPDGELQRLFFNVVFDETALLQDIPEENILISPVIECGPHDITLLKPVEIILPHFLYLGWTKKKRISVYRTDSGSINWKKIPSESERTDQSMAWFMVKGDSIHIKTTTFSLWSVFACGGPKKKRAAVFASKPDPESDLIYLRFYVYSDNEYSRGRVVMKEKEWFPGSRPAREKPFKLYNGNKVITVKLADIEEGWELDKTNEEQVYNCDNAHGRRFRSKDACDFAVKPIRGRAVKGFSCIIKFQQDGADELHEIYLNPGFTPLKKLEPVISPRQNSPESRVPEVKSHTDREAGSSSSSAPEEGGRDNFGKKSNSHPGLKRSQSLNVPRQRYKTCCDLEVILPTPRSNKNTTGCSKSSASEESDKGNLDKISKPPQEKPCLGDYRNVCSHYESYRDTVTTVFQGHEAGPSGALLQYVAVKHPRLTIAEFAQLSYDETRLHDRNEGDRLPNSFPTVPLLKYITQVEGYFSDSGGELSAAPDSDVKIVIGNGAVGDNQLVFFRVVDDETELLRDISVGSKETLVSPVIECGPHDIRILKPLEIIIPHCLYRGKAKEKSISVYRTDPGPIKWEKIPNELEKNDLSKAWFTAKENSIHIKTMTFCFWSIFSLGGPRKKRARVFANKPYPGSNLVYLRFYIYDDNEDSRKRVENQEEQSFTLSTPSIEKPFKMYNNSKKINVTLEDLKEGWELNNEADGHQEFTCLNANGRRFRCEGACEFLVKQFEGGPGNNFTCKTKFGQQGRDEEHAMYVVTRFAPEEKLEPVNNSRQNSIEACCPQAIPTTCTHLSSAAGCSTPSAPNESDAGNLEEHSELSRESKLLSSLLDNRPFLEKVCNRLDTRRPGVGDYHDVCLHYGIDSYKVTAVFEKDEVGPSKALLEHLAAARPQLTVAEFVGVLRKIAEREDVAGLLNEYNNQ